MINLKEKNCELCGNKFNFIRITKRFCSKRCIKKMDMIKNRGKNLRNRREKERRRYKLEPNYNIRVEKR